MSGLGLTGANYGAGTGGAGGLITSSTPMPAGGQFGPLKGGYKPGVSTRTEASEAQLTAQYGAMPDIVRKATAQKLKSAGYKVPVTGRYNATVREAFLDASRRFSDEINTLIRNDPQRLNTGKFDLDTYLADLAFTRAGTGTGDEVPKPYIQERQSTKASIRKGATAAAQVLLGRGLSEEQFNEIYKKAIEREKAMPVVTKYAKTKSGATKATTTGGADTEEFLYQQIAKTDEAKQNKIFGLYDAFKTAIGVK
jgi:hypothetical protein